MIFPVLAGLGALSLLSNPHRKRRKSRRRNPEQMIHGSKAIAEAMGGWHSSGGDSIYAVSSHWDGGHPVARTSVEGALANIRRTIDQFNDPITRKQAGWLAEDGRQLKKIERYLVKALGGDTRPRTTVKRYSGSLTVSLGVDEARSQPPRAAYFGHVNGGGADWRFNDLSILLPPNSGIDAPAAFDKAAEAALQFALNDVGDEIYGLGDVDPETAERETTFLIQRKKGGKSFHPARSNPRRKRRSKR